MNYFIYDREGRKQAPLQNVTSIQWKPRYYEEGKVVIYAKSTEDNLKYLVQFNRVICQERNEIMFIKSVVPKEDDETIIIVSGYMDNLDDRINTSTLTVRNVESSLLKCISENKRGLDIHVGNATGLEAKISDSETTWLTLRETVQKFCSLVGYGYREIVKNNVLNYFEIYSGTRREKARFSDDIGNILEQKYEVELSKYKNFAYVLGDDEDGVRRMVTVDIRTENEPLMEMYVDARDLQRTYKDSNGNEQTYTDSEYNELLKIRGQEKLIEVREDAFVFSFTLNPDDGLTVLGKDYDLGDLVPVISLKYGLKTYARITGIDFVEEGNENLKTNLILQME